MNSPFNFSIGKYAPDFVSRFDSATDMVGALSSFLKGEVFEGVGGTPTNEFYAKFINNIPNLWKQKIYTLGGKIEATSIKSIKKIDANEIDKWIYNIYPEKQYPAIAIGSSNGAMIHLCAALGIPWLPQTMLIPVNKGRDLPIDQPKETIKWAEGVAAHFLNNNPEWQLHHMMDPSQDRLRVGRIAYFRVKKLKLGAWYEKFIKERLKPGGSIILVDCQQKWPTVHLADRYYFQFGGMGGIAPNEYYQGNERTRKFLRQQNSAVESWDAPQPDGESPEAEWGFEPALLRDLINFAGQRSPVNKITFEHPQDLSPFVADLYRWWYPQVQLPAKRLLVESFTVQTPLLSLLTASIPYWLFFNVNQAADLLEDYLRKGHTFDEIYMMILSHGKKSWDYAPIERWRSIMELAETNHDFVGMEPEKYPLDLAIYARYSKELQRKIKERYPLPAPLTLAQLKEFTNFSTSKYKVEIKEKEALEEK